MRHYEMSTVPGRPDRNDDSCKETAELHQALLFTLRNAQTAFRIGTSKGLYPQKVYLHAGTRDGAKALGIYGEGKEVLKMSELRAELQKMKPYQVEDFLCIKKDVLHKFKQS